MKHLLSFFLVFSFIQFIYANEVTIQFIGANGSNDYKTKLTGYMKKSSTASASVETNTDANDPNIKICTGTTLNLEKTFDGHKLTIRENSHESNQYYEEWRSKGTFSTITTPTEPITLYYKCDFHSNMKGVIQIVDCSCSGYDCQNGILLDSASTKICSLDGCDDSTCCETVHRPSDDACSNNCTDACLHNLKDQSFSFAIAVGDSNTISNCTTECLKCLQESYKPCGNNDEPSKLGKQCHVCNQDYVTGCVETMEIKTCQCKPNKVCTSSTATNDDLECISYSSTDYNCYTREVWSAAKREWCCLNKGQGCICADHYVSADTMDSSKNKCPSGDVKQIGCQRCTENECCSHSQSSATCENSESFTCGKDELLNPDAKCSEPKKECCCIKRAYIQDHLYNNDLEKHYHEEEEYKIDTADTIDDLNEQEMKCVASGRCQLNKTKTDQDIQGKNIEPLRAKPLMNNKVELSFIKLDSGTDDIVFDNKVIELDGEETFDQNVELNSIRFLDENEHEVDANQLGGSSLSIKYRCRDEPWVASLNDVSLISRISPLQRRLKRCYLTIPIRPPCWVRYITIRIWKRVYRFPVFGWSKRCCNKNNIGMSNRWFSNATGCFKASGTQKGPFLNQLQCERTCGPFESPDEPCTFGDNTTIAHGNSTTCHGGAVCTCNNGELTCDTCRVRREIHDIEGTSFELDVVNALNWVNQGCDGQCNNWFQNIMQDHLTYSSHAHGNSKFFPWHRWYLKEVEMKMQLYKPCVTLPWWDWTRDQNPNDDTQFDWIDGTSESGTKQWGELNGNQNSQMGSFQTATWTIPNSFGPLTRSTSTSSISNLATLSTIANYLARSSYGSPGNFKAFEGPHGTPHMMVGGQMGGYRSPADPLFWLHHAGVDKLWYDWQDLHAPGTDYDANPADVLSPQWPTKSANDVFNSRNDVGVCYEGQFLGAGGSGSRRRLATAIEYGLIAALKSPIDVKQKTHWYAVEKIQTAISNDMSYGDNTDLANKKCGPYDSACIWKVGDNCMDVWAENMFLDPEEMRLNQCIDEEFDRQYNNTAQDLKNKTLKAMTAFRPYLEHTTYDLCATVKCTAHSHCKNGKCICNKGYRLDKFRCVPDNYKPDVCPAGCKSWYDGCNTCECLSTNQLGACTKRACMQYDTPKCNYYEDDSYIDDTSNDYVIDDNDECPKDCSTWYDGCNTCQCNNGKLGACTKRFCAVYEEAKCLDRICPRDCERWYDGCNTCKCKKDGSLGDCTELFCIQQGSSYCSKYRSSKKQSVKDTLPPVISLVDKTKMELKSTDKVKTDIFFNSDKNIEVIVDDNHFSMNERLLGFKGDPNTDDGNYKGYLSWDFLDEEDHTEFKRIVQNETIRQITYEIDNRTDSNLKSEQRFDISWNEMKIQKLPVPTVNVKLPGSGRRLNSRSLNVFRAMIPIEAISDSDQIKKLVFCRLKITIHFGTFFGGKTFTFTITRSGKQCCGWTTGDGTWQYNEYQNSCLQVSSNGVTSGPFMSQASCEKTCKKASCPLPNEEFSQQTSGRSHSFNHGQKFFSCTCNDGSWDVPTGCKYRKEVRDLLAVERTQLIDAMHWVRNDCGGNGCGSFETVHPPGGSSYDWTMDEFFTDHIRYSSDAHGQWKFFPWHRKYLKEYETKLQTYDPCVTLAWWDWTQDTDNTDGNFDWIKATNQAGFHNDWGVLSSDNNIAGSGTSPGDGMSVGRFQCGAANDYSTTGNNWRTTSSTLGYCLWRNTDMSYMGWVPDDADVANYLSKSNYDSGFSSFMDFEGNPHGAPHVMVGGGGSWSSQYGQMGNGRSPTDPIFFLHHAAVDKLWHDWQNNDPSHFNDLGGSGTTRANTQLSTQWPSVTAGDMLDSEGDLKVCYSEPKPKLIGPIKWLDLPILKLAAVSRTRRRLKTSQTNSVHTLLKQSRKLSRRRLPHYTTWTTFKEDTNYPSDQNNRVETPAENHNVVLFDNDVTNTQIDNEIVDFIAKKGCEVPLPYDHSKIKNDGFVTWGQICFDQWLINMNQDPTVAKRALQDSNENWRQTMHNLTSQERQSILSNQFCHMENCTDTQMRDFYNLNRQQC